MLRWAGDGNQGMIGAVKGRLIYRLCLLACFLCGKVTVSGIQGIGHRKVYVHSQCAAFRPCKVLGFIVHILCDDDTPLYMR